MVLLSRPVKPCVNINLNISTAKINRQIVKNVLNALLGLVETLKHYHL